MQSLTLFRHILAVVSGLLVGFTLGLIGGGGSILAVPLLLTGKRGLVQLIMPAARRAPR